MEGREKKRSHHDNPFSCSYAGVGANCIRPKNELHSPKKRIAFAQKMKSFTDTNKKNSAK